MLATPLTLSLCYLTFSHKQNHNDDEAYLYSNVLLNDSGIRKYQIRESLFYSYLNLGI